MDGQLAETTVAAIAAYIQEQKSIMHLWLYLLVLSMVECMVGLGYQEAGALMHMVILSGLYCSSSYYRQDDIHKLYLALSLAPLTRIINLSLPPFPLHPVFYYFLAGVPMLVGAYLVAQEIGFSFSKAFLGSESFIQVIGGYCLGVIIGLMNYLLFRPQIVAPGYEELPFLIVSFTVLIGSGFLEELLFRGILYRAAVETLGQQVGWQYSSLIYASLQLGRFSAGAVLIALVSALVLANFVRRQDSLIGAGIAHAIANICLFFVGPLLF
jgi:membrane protease YdiL (CAAX protease family)